MPTPIQEKCLSGWKTWTPTAFCFGSVVPHTSHTSHTSHSFPSDTHFVPPASQGFRTRHWPLGFYRFRSSSDVRVGGVGSYFKKVDICKNQRFLWYYELLEEENFLFSTLVLWFCKAIIAWVFYRYHQTLTSLFEMENICGKRNQIRSSGPTLTNIWGSELFIAAPPSMAPVSLTPLFGTFCHFIMVGETNEPRQKTKVSYFPLNPGWLIGILKMLYYYNPYINE